MVELGNKKEKKVDNNFLLYYFNNKKSINLYNYFLVHYDQ